MSPRLRPVVTVLLTALAGSASAQQALHCRDLDPTAPEDAYRAFECVSMLDADLEAAKARIEALEDNMRRIERLLQQVQPVPAVGDHDNTRAIVAYYSEKGEKSCPEGWSPYEAAKDRFIVGAGGAYPTVGETGGEASVKLSVAHLPPHTHATSLTKVSGIGGTHGAAAAAGGNETVKYTSSETGSGQAHNNMPPFIALFFCKRD